MSGWKIAKTFLVLSLVVSVSAQASLKSRVSKKLTGGTVATKNFSQWELYRFKDTVLPTMKPFCYCPWLSYLTINQNVIIEESKNKNVIRIRKNIKLAVQKDALYNRNFGKHFKVKGSERQKVRKIFNFCNSIDYTPHVKTAKEVFQSRRGDCAGISAAFYVLCICKNIKVKYVIGWSENECHAWNKVMINKKWYWIDCTYGYWLSEKQYDGRTVMEIW